ncbi:hypothetical protein ACFW95_05845 [Streptomyces sp. NPDC059474]|uniref:hypothetical protein n=1 Tax=Streptomyces sp. NPDC059474 TaxID=3346846 RepID=UPI0036A5E9AF
MANRKPPLAAIPNAIRITASGIPGARTTRGEISGAPPRRASRVSYAAKSATRTALSPSAIQPHSGRPRSCPSTSGTVKSSTAAASSTRPGRSRPLRRAAWPSARGRGGSGGVQQPRPEDQQHGVGDGVARDDEL